MSDEEKKTMDYTSSFEYPSITKIHGEPDCEQLKKLKDKLKANATKIPSELGGGAHGHLGLVLSATEYINISAVSYVRSLHPGVLIIPPNATERTEKRRRDEHRRLMALFHETVNLENAL